MALAEGIFFEKQTPSSRIKAGIVSEYFPDYCKIITTKHKPQEIRYIDLFAGPGYYKDGNASTPILIGRQSNNSAFLRNNVRLIFNDNVYKEALASNFAREFPAGTFNKEPRFGDRTIGQDDLIRKFLIRDTHVNGKNSSPALLFIDPFGYKGIETEVLARFLKNWGNEIFLFVNIKRIHPALENEKFGGLMMDLFPTTFERVKLDRRFGLTTRDRITLIIQSLGREYESLVGHKIFDTAFKFQEEESDATSHYILHLTKSSRGFDLVKQIYNDFANVGTVFDGVNTYTFDAKKLNAQTDELFDLNSMNIDALKDEIFCRYKSKTVTATELYEEHHISNLYSRSHYTKALRKLAEERKLTSIFTDNKIHKVPVLISDECRLTFA